jgi:hypothetical protein
VKCSLLPEKQAPAGICDQPAIEVDWTAVDQSPPAIYARQPSPPKLDLGYRLVALGFALACLTVLGVAAHLTPNPKGISSHTGLGLSPCAFEERTGLPCPTCGMTTSFSHFVRGNILASFYVQPLGMILALLTTMTFWGGLYVAFTGRPAYWLLRSIQPRYYLIPLFVMIILAWAWKIWIHVNHRDGWG